MIAIVTDRTVTVSVSMTILSHYQIHAVSCNTTVHINNKIMCGLSTWQSSILGPLLYSLYTAQLVDLHFYADDSQLYVVFDPSCAWDTDTAKCKIEACVLEMYSWLLSNGLMPSKDKTKLTIISSMFRPRPQLNSVFVSDELIHVSSHTSNPG